MDFKQIAISFISILWGSEDKLLAGKVLSIIMILVPKGVDVSDKVEVNKVELQKELKGYRFC